MKGENILLAEDDPSAIEMLTEVLALDDYTVEVVDAAQPCIDALRARRFSAVLLDLSLPGLTQADWFAALKALPEPSPLIVFSARPAEEVGSIAAHLDAAAVLTKPSDIDYMLATIHRVARRPAA